MVGTFKSALKEVLENIENTIKGLFNPRGYKPDDIKEVDRLYSKVRSKS